MSDSAGRKVTSHPFKPCDCEPVSVGTMKYVCRVPLSFGHRPCHERGHDLQWCGRPESAHRSAPQPKCECGAHTKCNEPPDSACRSHGAGCPAQPLRDAPPEPNQKQDHPWRPSHLTCAQCGQGPWAHPTDAAAAPDNAEDRLRREAEHIVLQPCPHNPGQKLCRGDCIECIHTALEAVVAEERERLHLILERVYAASDPDDIVWDSVEHELTTCTSCRARGLEEKP